MTSINDFATTYMCQSLPFGGVKESGFDRFAGIEGLRGMCISKAVCEDRCACHALARGVLITLYLHGVEGACRSPAPATCVSRSAEVPVCSYFRSSCSPYHSLRAWQGEVPYM